MREILFKGKQADNGKWVYGFLVEALNCVTDKSETFIIEQDATYFTYGEFACAVEVKPETVGQFTGLCDKNGKKIFEWDIMQLCSACYPCLVYWDGRSWAWKQNGKRREIDLTREKMEIIGNIYDNKEEEE